MGQMKPFESVIQFSGHTTAARKRLELPLGQYSQLDIYGSYTVADISIAPGENIRGAIDEILVHDGKGEVIKIGRNELDIVCDLLNPGVTTGKFFDPDPVNGVAQKFHFRLPASLDLNDPGASPWLEVAMRAATDEWGSATAFDASFSILLSPIGDVADVPNAYVIRRAESGATVIRADIPAGTLGACLVVFASPPTLTKIGIDGLYEMTDARILHAAYSSYKDTTQEAAPTRFLWDNIVVPSGGARKLQIEQTGTVGVTLFFVGVKE